MMDENKHSYAGDSMRRVEDEEMITGAGCYTDDLQFPEMTHLHFVRSPYPHAKIKKMDLSVAMESEGVFEVYTADDLIRDGVNPIRSRDLPGILSLKKSWIRDTATVTESRWILRVGKG